MSAVRWVGVLCAAVAFVVVTTSVVLGDREVAKREEAEKDQRFSDISMCRGRIGFDDYNLGDLRYLVLACGEEVAEREVAKGRKRSEAYKIAADQCWPDIDVCDRALPRFRQDVK